MRGIPAKVKEPYETEFQPDDVYAELLSVLRTGVFWRREARSLGI